MSVQVSAPLFFVCDWLAVEAFENKGLVFQRQNVIFRREDTVFLKEDISERKFSK